jgi:predicted XRE-type DNA-binding protein
MSDEQDVIVSSGNVFADLGVTDPEEALAKAALAHEVARVIAERGWTQAQAANVLGIDQPKVSALVRGRLAGFSLGRLFRLLNALGRNVEIVVTPKTPSQRRAGLVVSSGRTPSPTAAGHHPADFTTAAHQ